ncbi:MAG TPA: histidine kinase [Cyclobacteriaceae bacterium]|nr:histidine kinase [Cyclobacteriaceae bacterium]
MQFIGWFTLMFVEIYNFTFFIRGEFQWIYLYSFGVFSVIGLVSTHYYKLFFIRSSTFTKGLSKIWTKALLDVVLISLIMVIIGRVFSLLTVHSIAEMSWERMLKSVLPQWLNIARYVVVWIIFYYLYHILQRNNSMLKEKLETENKTKHAELELLKTQLNPHFLFQSLSSIKAMVLQDKEQARMGIIQLSELLRYSLNYEKNSLVKLEVELEELEKYVALEKMRLGERLNFSKQIDKKLLSEELPTASLLNMVENSIRNGIEKIENGGKLMLSAYEQDRLNVYEMQGEYDTSARGLELTEGMENLQKRIEKIYEAKAQLLIQADDQQQLNTKLLIPKSN